MPGPVLGDHLDGSARSRSRSTRAQQASVKVGDAVTITLPDNQTTPGRITLRLERRDLAVEQSWRGAVTAAKKKARPTIEVDATPTDPARDGPPRPGARERVQITTESVENALAVPVDALLALAGGGYAVEVAEGRVHRLVAVTLGLFDDAEGLVQVSGQGLSAGQRVVVPAT